MEIIIVLFVISVILSFAVPKFTQINDKSHLVTLKSQYSLIQSGISKNKNKNILLSNSYEISFLDEASINKKDEKLFTKVVDFVILATNSNERKAGYWVKTSSNNYSFYLSSGFINFAFEDEIFKCKSSDEICKEIE